MYYDFYIGYRSNSIATKKYRKTDSLSSVIINIGISGHSCQLDTKC